MLQQIANTQHKAQLHNTITHLVLVLDLLHRLELFYRKQQTSRRNELNEMRDIEWFQSRQRDGVMRWEIYRNNFMMMWLKRMGRKNCYLPWADDGWEEYSLLHTTSFPSLSSNKAVQRWFTTRLWASNSCRVNPQGVVMVMVSIRNVEQNIEILYSYNIMKRVVSE